MSVAQLKPSQSLANPSANDVLKIAENLSGEDKEASVPSLGLLQLIILIRKAEAGNGDDAWTPLVENSLRHMKAAVRLINEDPLIAMKFGNTLEGAMKLVGILKARAGEKDLESRIDGIVRDEIQPHMPSKTLQASSVFKSRADLSKSRRSASSGLGYGDDDE